VIDIAPRTGLIVVVIPSPTIIVRPGTTTAAIIIITTPTAVTVIKTATGPTAGPVALGRIVAQGFVLLPGLTDACMGIQTQIGANTT